MDQDKLLETFITEASELVQDLEMDLVELEDSNSDDELINRIFRAAHTIKGSGGIVGLSAISDFTHTMENVLDLVRQHELPVTRGLIDVLLKSVDLLKTMIKDASCGIYEISDTEEMNKVLDKLSSFLPGANKNNNEPQIARESQCEPETGKMSYFEIFMSLPDDLMETGTDPTMLLRELKDIGEVIEIYVDTSRVPDFTGLDIYKLYLKWRIVLKSSEPLSKIENVFIFVSANDDYVVVDDVSQHYKDDVDLRIAGLKLGEILSEKGLISEKDVEDALLSRPKIGEILIENGKVSKEDVRIAVEKQQKSREIQKTSTIRVDTDKLDKLVNLVGEMVIAVARVSDWRGNQIDSDDHSGDDGIDNLVNICRDLQEQVMRVRMVAVEGLFSRYHRVVRDMANDGGKEIRLELSGMETELDKNVIEQMSDPLKHLIRNAVDHGLESPDIRENAGKPREGVVGLSAYQQEGNIIVEVWDDGRGINKDAVRQKAVERSLLRDDEEISDKELFNLMFEPGFSTAEKVTEVSGRGVGLDVVKKNITELRGSIEVISTPGKGSTFKIMLPLTLAIIDGMTVRVGNEIFVLPLSSIIESLRPEKAAIKAVQGEGEILDARGEYLPLIRLHRLFNIETDKTEPSEALIVIVESAMRRFGIMVDEVLGQQQAVIKSIEKSLQKIEGIAGATIQGNGAIALIIDIHSLEKAAFGVPGDMLMAC